MGTFTRNRAAFSEMLYLELVVIFHINLGYDLVDLILKAQN